MKKLLKNFLLISLTSIYLFGFRVIPSGNSWKINNTSSANAKLFVIYENGSSIVPNDLGAIDPLYGVANLDFDQIMASIFNDFNNIADAWVTLVDDTDSDYNATNALDRTIRIKFSSTNGNADGIFVPEYDGSTITGCEISILPKMLNSAKDLIWIVNHEMGHCLGLEHPQETTDAIMSYFSNRDNPRLRADDKMGIVHLYPVNPSAAKEKATFGLSCERR